MTAGVRLIGRVFTFPVSTSGANPVRATRRGGERDGYDFSGRSNVPVPFSSLTHSLTELLTFNKADFTRYESEGSKPATPAEFAATAY